MVLQIQKEINLDISYCVIILQILWRKKYRSKYFSTDEINADGDDGDGIPDDQENSNTYGILDHMGKILTIKHFL